MADIEISWDALLTPTDHALAHALSIHLLTVVPEDGWDTILRDTMERCVSEVRQVIHPHALALRNGGDWILKTPAGSADRCRATIETRQRLITFHKWRMGLSLERRGTVQPKQQAG